MNIKDISKTIDILQVLNDALAAPKTVNEGLRKIVELTCQLMDTEQAAFLQIDDDNHRFIVRVTAGMQSETFREGQPLQVPERISNLLWRLHNLHQIKYLESDIKDLKFPIIAMPVMLKGHRIGHLIAAGARDSSKAMEPLRRKIFSLLAPFASLIVENAKATDLINQHFALRSQELMKSMEDEAKAGGQKAADAEKNAASTAETLMVNTVRNPEKVVRLLSESFYRELSHAGFTPGQIIAAATRLLECIAAKE